MSKPASKPAVAETYFIGLHTFYTGPLGGRHLFPIRDYYGNEPLVKKGDKLTLLDAEGRLLGKATVGSFEYDRVILHTADGRDLVVFNGRKFNDIEEPTS